MWKQKEKHILNKTTIKFRSAIGQSGKLLKTCQSIDLMCAVRVHWTTASHLLYIGQYI